MNNETEKRRQLQYFKRSSKDEAKAENNMRESY